MSHQNICIGNKGSEEGVGLHDNKIFALAIKAQRKELDCMTSFDDQSILDSTITNKTITYEFRYYVYMHNTK